jgi:hypothetical protein
VGVARRQGSRATVYASWNGATRVVSWRVLARSSSSPPGARVGESPPAGRLSVVASAPKSGFETAIPIAHAYPSYEVQALDAGGRVIGSTRFGA